MTESGDSPHLLTGCEAYAAICEKCCTEFYTGPSVFRVGRGTWVATIYTNKISVRGEGSTIDAACQNAVNKYEQAIR